MKKLIMSAGAAGLLAASALTALAAEASGTIASIDATAGPATLDDGKMYQMPTTVALATFMPGQRVMITFSDGASAPFMASAITLAPGAAAPGAGSTNRPAGTGSPDPGIAGPGAPRPD